MNACHIKLGGSILSAEGSIYPAAAASLSLLALANVELHFISSVILIICKYADSCPCVSLTVCHKN